MLSIKGQKKEGKEKVAKKEANNKNG